MSELRRGVRDGRFLGQEVGRVRVAEVVEPARSNGGAKKALAAWLWRCSAKGNRASASNHPLPASSRWSKRFCNSLSRSCVIRSGSGRCPGLAGDVTVTGPKGRVTAAKERQC